MHGSAPGTRDRQTDRQTDGRTDHSIADAQQVCWTYLLTEDHIYAAGLSYKSDNAHRPPLHGLYGFARTLLLQRALPLGQTDGRTDRRTRHRFNTRSA